MSVIMHNQNINDSASDDSSKEALELYGIVYVHDSMACVGEGWNRIVFFQREEEIDDPEIIPFVGGALSVTGSVISMKKPVIGIHISDKFTGGTLISKFAPLLKSTDTAEQRHHHFEQFHKLTIPGIAFNAEVEYLSLTFGVHANVSVQLFKQQEQEEDEDEDGYGDKDINIYGTITAAYNLYNSENKVCIDLFKIKVDSDESQKVNLVFPEIGITLARSMIAVPAYSLVTIQVKLWDRANNELIVEGSYDRDTSSCPTSHEIIVGQSGLNAKVIIDWGKPFSDRRHDSVYLKSLVIPPNSVPPVAEVFGVSIGRRNNEELSLYGMVNFHGARGILNLFQREKTDPFILPQGCNLLPLRGPKDALVLPEDSFYVSVDLEDVEGRASIKGAACSSLETDENLGHWRDRLLCSVIGRAKEHSFAAIHYTVFSYGLKATLKIRFFFNGEYAADAFCTIHGNVFASYGKYGRKTSYEKLYDRIVLFEENSLQVPCKEFDMELLRDVVGVPRNSLLRIAVNLSCQSSGCTHLLRDAKEFEVCTDSGEGVTIIKGDQVGINITVEWSLA